jgi:hypothetical protein
MSVFLTTITRILWDADGTFATLWGGALPSERAQKGCKQFDCGLENLLPRNSEPRNAEIFQRREAIQ